MLTQEEQETTEQPAEASPPTAEAPPAVEAPPVAEVAPPAEASAPPSETADDAPVAPLAGEAGAAPEDRAAGPGSDRDRSDRGRPEPGERRRRHFGRRKVCSFCVEKAKAIDYKDAAKLRRYLSDRGRIDARRKTGTCAKHQRWLALALKRARHLALLPYSPEHIRASGMFASRR